MMENTKSLKLIRIYILLLSLMDNASGEKDMFLTKYRRDIENYIMTGYGQGWKHCDLIHDTYSSLSSYEVQGGGGKIPIFVVDADGLQKIDTKTTFSSSKCLLISAYIKDNQSLSNLIKLGWSVVQHKRLALVLKLSQDLALDIATNTTKLPFVIASRIEDGKEQFLCPIIGEPNPRIQNVICDQAYTSYKHKPLRVGIFGVPPEVMSKFKSS